MAQAGADELLHELAALATSLLHTVAPPALRDGILATTALAQRYFAAAACSVAVVDEDDEELEYIAASGAGADAVIGLRLPMGRGIAGWVAQSGQPIAVSDLSRDTRFARDVAESTSYVPSALLAVPIESEDRLLGVLSILDRDESRADAAHDLETGALFAAQAATTMQAAAAFSDAGRVLLRALTAAADGGTSLSAALIEAAGSRRPGELTEFAGLLAQLQHSGAQERQLAVRVLREILTFVNRTGGGQPSANR